MGARLLAGLLLLGLAGAVPAALPDIERWTSAKGARVLYVHAPEIPMVDVEVVFDAGAARDDGLDGLARLVNGLLEEGADGMGADAIADGFSELGTETGFSSMRDMASASLRSLSEPAKLEPAVALLSRVIAHPDFPPAAVERVRAQMLAGLLQVKQSPGRLASRTFYETLFAGHPYAFHPAGTQASLERITGDDLRAFHRRYYVARNAVVAVVGDISRGAAEEMVDRLLAGLPEGKPAPAPGEAPPAEAVTTFIDYPSEQVHLVMGQPGVRRGDPDYFPLYLGNHILGGSGLVSQLSKAVREERGLSYSVSSSLVPMRSQGPFKITLQTKNENAGEAMRVVEASVERFVEHGPDADELDAAKRNIVNGFPLRVDSNSKVLGYLVMMGFYGLPVDYLATFTERVEAVTAADIREAFRRRIAPHGFVRVLAGDLEEAQKEAIAGRDTAAAGG